MTLEEALAAATPIASGPAHLHGQREASAVAGDWAYRAVQSADGSVVLVERSSHVPSGDSATEYRIPLDRLPDLEWQPGVGRFHAKVLRQSEVSIERLRAGMKSVQVGARLPGAMVERLDARGERSDALRDILADFNLSEDQLGSLAPGELPKLAEHLRAIRNDERKRLMELMTEADFDTLRRILAGSYVDSTLINGLELELQDADAELFAPGQQANLHRLVRGLSYAARWTLVEMVTRRGK